MCVCAAIGVCSLFSYIDAVLRDIAAHPSLVGWLRAPAWSPIVAGALGGFAQLPLMRTRVLLFYFHFVLSFSQFLAKRSVPPLHISPSSLHSCLNPVRLCSVCVLVHSVGSCSVEFAFAAQDEERRPAELVAGSVLACRVRGRLLVINSGQHGPLLFVLLLMDPFVLSVAVWDHSPRFCCRWSGRRLPRAVRRTVRCRFACLVLCSRAHEHACRLAGGCPSGHGLSGVPFLSTRAAAVVAAMFAGGSLGLAYLHAVHSHDAA